MVVTVQPTAKRVIQRLKRRQFSAVHKRLYFRAEARIDELEQTPNLVAPLGLARFAVAKPNAKPAADPCQMVGGEG